MTTPRLLTTTEAAPLLGVSDARGVQALCRAEAIEHYRFESPGGRIQYRLDEGQIAAYLTRHRVRPAVASLTGPKFAAHAPDSSPRSDRAPRGWSEAG